MSNDEQVSNLPLGLDVGTSRIVVARSTDRAQQSEYESQLNAFITMPYSKLAESLLADKPLVSRAAVEAHAQAKAAMPDDDEGKMIEIVSRGKDTAI